MNTQLDDKAVDWLLTITAQINQDHPIDDNNLLFHWNIGDLPESDQKRFVKHVTRCAYCHKNIVEMEDHGILARKIPRFEDISPLRSRSVMQSIVASISSLRYHPVLCVTAASLLICVIAGLLAGKLFSPHGADIALKTGRSSLTEYGYNMSGNMTVKDVPKTEEEEKTQYLDRLNEKPEDVELRFEFGHWLLSKQDVSEAIKQFERLEKTHPKSATIQNALGMAWYMQETNRGNAPEKSLQCFSQALKFSPNDPDINRNMGICLSKLGKAKEANAYFEKVERFSK